MAPAKTPVKPGAKGKGKILGMPTWAAGLAIAIGLVAGYFLLVRGKGGAAAAADSSQSKAAAAPDQGSGGGGGLIPAMPPNVGNPLTAGGINSSGGFSSGATNTTTQESPATGMQFLGANLPSYQSGAIGSTSTGTPIIASAPIYQTGISPAPSPVTVQSRARDA